jgi:hypothetical protein
MSASLCLYHVFSVLDSKIMHMWLPSKCENKIKNFVVKITEITVETSRTKNEDIAIILASVLFSYGSSGNCRTVCEIMLSAVNRYKFYMIKNWLL